MAKDTIRVDYYQLEEINRRFGQQAEENGQMIQRLRRVMEDLKNGGWEGEGSQAFFTQMNNEVLPALQRLINGLEDGGQVVGQIAQNFRQAEEEASNGFNGDSSPGSGTIEEILASNPNPGIISNVSGFEGSAFMSQTTATSLSNEVDHDNIINDIAMGEHTKDKLLDDVHKMVGSIHAMSENPVGPGGEAINLAGSIFKDGTGGVTGLTTSIAGMFIELGISNQAGDIASKRAPLYQAYAEGIAGALDPNYRSATPSNPSEKAFFELGKAAVSQMSDKERYRLKVNLVETFRRKLPGIGWERTPKFVEDHYKGSYFSKALRDTLSEADYRYRNP